MECTVTLYRVPPSFFPAASSTEGPTSSVGSFLPPSYSPRPSCPLPPRDGAFAVGAGGDCRLLVAAWWPPPLRLPSAAERPREP